MLDGVWDLVVEAPMGEQHSVITLREEGGVVSGESAQAGAPSVPLVKAKRVGDKVSWSADITKPMRLKIDFTLTLAGDTLEGVASPGFFGKFPARATRRN